MLVPTGGTLGGNGSTGAVTVAGTITAGPNAVTTGTLNTAGQTWNASGGYTAKVAGTGNITGNDTLVMSSLTVANGFTVSLMANNGSTPAFTAQNTDGSGTVAGAPAGSFVILARDNEGTGSPFANQMTINNLNLTFSPGTVAKFSSGDSIQLAGLSDPTAGFYDLVAEDVAAAPEPTSLVLFGGVVAPLLLGRRRRRAARLA